MRALVIDDDYTSRVQAKALLSTYGDCDAAPNGRLGLELLKASHKDPARYELLLLDVNMPDMTGQQVVEALRKWELDTRKGQFGREVKIIMLSALDDARNVLGSFNAGCEDYIVKPLTPEKLAKALNKLGLTA